MLMIWTFMCHTATIWVTETNSASETMERPKVGLTLPKQDFVLDLHKRVKTHMHLLAMLSHIYGDLLTPSQVSHWYVGRRGGGSGGVKRPLSANQIVSLLCMCTACSLRQPLTPGPTCVVYTRTHTNTSGPAGGKADTQLTP